MTASKRSWAARLFLALLVPTLFLNCSLGARSVSPAGAYPARIPTQPEATAASAGGILPVVVTPPAAPSPTQTPTQVLPVPPDQTATPDPALAGEPAGCLTTAGQAELSSVAAMLDYAGQLAHPGKALPRRILPGSWNAFTQSSFPRYAAAGMGAVSLAVGDIQPEYKLQSLLNALQVAGFVTWLRKTETLGLHILAIPLIDPQWAASPWEPYIRAYWLDSGSLPEGDAGVLPALKLPPCQWMVDLGYAPAVGQGWWAEPSSSPDYARAAQSYLADSNDAAVQIARRINWLGDAGREGPNTMCGPLAWSILKDAGALPPGFGGWSEGPKSFWLAKPTENGRPWSLFPTWMGRALHYRSPLGSFDFKDTPLYPGDFLYTYSENNGFDHMLVVTEVDSRGDVYTVTNIVRVQPVKETTVERALLLNLQETTSGIARNQWAKDGVNGRTGHKGFDIFRWAWVEKDRTGQPADYTVQVGDTLSLVALLWKTPAGQIAEYNGIKAGQQLTLGKVLRIPPNTLGERKPTVE